MNKRDKITAILFAAIIILGTLMLTPTATAQIASPTVSKTVNPTHILLNEETTITLTIQGAGSEWNTSVPIDVVFALDSSGSMSWNDPSGLRKTAAKNFVDKLNSTTDQAGVVSWDDNIDFTQALTNNFPLVKSKIDAVDSSGNTNLDVGLNAAINLLDAGKRVNASWVIIFLSNGQGTYSHSTAVAAANKGYTVYTIGLAISPGSTAENNLKDMANTTGGKYYPSPNATNLDAIFNDIYKEVVTSTIPHYVDVVEVTQSYIINESSFNVAPNSISTDLVTGETTIIWNNIGMLNDGDPDLSSDEIVTLTFKAKSIKSGMNLDVDVYGKAKVNYKDSSGADGGSVLIPQAKINVNAPPVANASGPYVGYEGQPITFNGSASYDPNDFIISWEWDLDYDGIYETNATATQGIVNNTWCDDYSGCVCLKVTDSLGANDTNCTNVTVLNVPPIADAGSDQVVEVFDVVTFNGDAIDTPCDVLTFAWDFGDGNVAAGQNVTHVYDWVDVYTVTLNVTDDDGGLGSDTAIVNVTKRQTWITYTGDTSGYYNDTIVVSAILTDKIGGVANKTIKFTLGNQTATALTNASGYASTTMVVDIMPVNLTEDHPITAEFAGDEYYKPSLDVSTFVVKSARWLKQDAIVELEAINTTSKQAQHDISKAIKLINESLNPALWIDASRLDPKHGHKVFDRQKHAVKELLKIVEERGQHADPTIVDEVKAVIDKLIKADELLALVAIADAKNANIVDSKFEKKVEQEIAKAEEELAKAYQALGADNPDKAIDHFKLAWKHAQLAMKFAQGVC